MSKQEALTNIMLDFGVAKVGFSNLEDILPEGYKHLKSGITLVVRLSDQVIHEIDVEAGPTHMYFHHYRTVNAFIDQATLKLCNALQQWGYLAMPIAASQTINKDGWNYNGLFPHRTGATRSGLGWIGKNCCLITEDFGPRVRLGTVLTNMDFDYGTPIETSECGECNLCVKACPANALKGNSWHAGIERQELLDPKICSDHMRSKYQHIGRGAVCGICIKSCPMGKKVLKR